MKNTDKNTITLPNYPSPPPYGGTTIDWWKFFLAPHKWPLIFWSIISFFRQSFFRSHPFFLGVTIGLVESGEAAADPMKLVWWIALYASLLSIAAAGIFLIIPAGNLMDKISKEIALYGFQHYLNLPESWHEDKASGEKLQRLTTARKESYRLMENTFWHVIALPGILCVIVLSLALLGAPLHYMVIYTVFIASFAWGGVKTSEWLHERFKDRNSTLEKVVGGVYEFILSTATVRYFNLKKHVMDKGAALETINHTSHRNIHKTVVKRWLILDSIALFWIFIIIALASFEAIQGTLPLPAYAAILFFNLTIWTELEYFSMIYKDLIEYWEGVKRLFNVLSEEPAITDKPNAKTLTTTSAAIHFDAVNFDYNQQKSIIQNFDLSINAGEKIGMVGPSGAGKSTIVKLLLRFYDINDGAIRINDHNIQDITLASLQEAVAVIPQDVTLFNHALIENIRYGRLGATDEDVFDAARKANAHDFIQDMPQGYNTIVGERGVKLSGGQRQRIAIARAILKDAPILILDEATSALDSESELLIQQSLADLMRGKTVIAIAHRLSTIANLDRLIVMENGTLIEDGSHAELLKRKDGLYAKLWSMQSGGFLKD